MTSVRSGREFWWQARRSGWRVRDVYRGAWRAPGVDRASHNWLPRTDAVDRCCGHRWRG